MRQGWSWVCWGGLAFILAFWGCRRPEKPWKLPEGIAGRVIEAHTGPEYDTVAFLNFELGSVHKVPRTAWDLLLKPAGTKYELWLNAAMYAFAAEVDESTWQNLSTPERTLSWKCDLADTAALTPLRSGESRYFILDRDRGEVFYRQPQKRYRKVAIQWEGQTIKVLSLPFGTGDTAQWNLRIGEMYYLSLENPGNPVSIAPPWRVDLVLSRYIHPFYDQSEEFRWYPVLGALLGHGIEAGIVHAHEIPYEKMDYTQLDKITFSSRRDLLGYDWKKYDFGTGTYTIDFSRYFVLRVSPTTYYKGRFIDFYDNQGRKGCVRIEYEPL